MSGSFCQIVVHLVFSTKGWKRWLQDDVKKEIHSYIGGIIYNVKGKPLIINGTDDHVHILCLLPKNMCISEFTRTIKANSSKWLRKKHNLLFNWQEGYGAYSVGLSNINQVKRYIANQEEHHKKHSGQEEFDAFWEEQKSVIE